jgi:exopolysaccharide production protein ExoY
MDCESKAGGASARLLVGNPYLGRSKSSLAKRVFDFTAAFLLLLAIWPLLLLVAIAILITDGRPVIFRHKRVGRHGKVIPVLKFRSMRKNAEEILKRDPELLRQFQENFKLDRDPRVTRIGHILRSTSIDELPQLWNVLVGQMSLVGPRPIVQDELARYGEHADVYLSLVPGCTGLWQCSGRSDTTYEERVQFDVQYAREASLGLDIMVTLKTIPAVLARRGAK